MDKFDIRTASQDGADCGIIERALSTFVQRAACGDAEGLCCSAVLAALYLRGAPRQGDPPPRRWQALLSALRREGASIASSAQAAERAGFSEETWTLRQPGVLPWAERLVVQGRVLTAACAGYPERWAARLGPAAPPALWRSGEVPAGPFLTIVGSRRVPSAVRRFAAGCAREGLRLGFSIASGAASGCDAAAAQAALEAGDRSLLEVLPCGIGRWRGHGGALVSLWPAQVPFSAPQAMERNHLLYAISEFAVVAHARFKAGGTWTGAADALRRRLCRVLVRWDAGDRAVRALAALGSTPLARASGLEEALSSPPIQPGFPAICPDSVAERRVLAWRASAA